MELTRIKLFRPDLGSPVESIDIQSERVAQHLARAQRFEGDSRNGRQKLALHKSSAPISRRVCDRNLPAVSSVITSVQPALNSMNRRRSFPAITDSGCRTACPY